MSKKWRGQEAIVEAEDSEGTSLPVGLLQDFEISVPYEVQQLRGSGDDISFQDVFRSEVEVNFEGEIMEWDTDFWYELIGFDEAAGELDTTPEVPTVTVTGTIEATDGTEQQFELADAYDDEGTISGARDEWIGIPLSLTAPTMTDPTVDSTS